MRNMQKMWEDYAKEVQVLRERIAELREVLQRDKTMAPLERQELEARKRLLSEEVPSPSCPSSASAKNPQVPAIDSQLEPGDS